MIPALLCIALLTQGSDDALRDRVAQLVEKLAAAKVEARDSAEKALITLGARALPLLPEAAKVGAGANDRDTRLERVRSAIRESLDKLNLGASTVTLQGKGIRLSEALQRIQAQTGNPITDLREQMGAEATNPGLDLDLKDRPFFEAIDDVAAKAGLALNFFTGDGTLGLTAGAMPAAPDKARASSYMINTGPFRVMLKQVGTLRDFQSGAATSNLQLEVGWEPRLRPMLLALKSEGIEVVDDLGKSVAADVQNMSTDVALRPDNPAAELNLNLAAPDRAAKMLAKLKVSASVTVPAGLRTFRFSKIEAPGVVQTQGDIAVTLDSFEVDEQVWKFHVDIKYPDGGPAFESFRQGLFNNRLWLQKADGSRFEHNGGYSNLSADGGKLSFEYLFVDVPDKPGDYQLAYETPSKVIEIPLDFEFKDVPLP
ncbi:hypothetical protein EP7_000670 [Isosphaeraceae bacterium EP7]